MLISLIEAQDSYRGCFRFDSRFLEVAGVQDTVARAWNDSISRGGSSVSNRLKSCRKALSSLKRQANMNSRDRIHQAEMALEQEQSALTQSTDRIHFLKRELLRAQRDEETYWWQRSKEKWLQRGDKNSTFFHNSDKARRARKHIDKLVDDDGAEVFSEAAKGDVAVKFYSNLFRSSNPTPFTSWFQDLRTRVTAQMKGDLTKRVSAEEIKDALFSIHPSKAPGPDGMSALFFQRFWHLVEAQVVREIQRFFEEGILPKEWNYTHLCLIPKIPDPESISDLRPISLCSVTIRSFPRFWQSDWYRCFK